MVHHLVSVYTIVCHVTFIIKFEEDMADDKDVEKTIAEDLVVTKYKMAGDIVNREWNYAVYMLFYKYYKIKMF